jgi:hypothetical protein
LKECSFLKFNHKKQKYTLLFFSLFFYQSEIFAESFLNGSLETSFNANSLNRHEDESYSQDFSLTLYKMFEKNRLLLQNSVSKDWQGEQKWSYNDPTLMFSHPIYEEGTKSVSLSETMLFGFSDDSRKNTTLLTSLRITPTFNFKKGSFPIEDLTFSYAPSLRKSFHQEKVGANGRSNFEWTLAHKFSLSYSFLEKYYLSGSLSYQRSWTYHQTDRDRVDHAEALGMDLSSNISLELGHSYGSSPLTPDGKDFRVNFYDPRFSTIYVSLGLSF